MATQVSKSKTLALQDGTEFVVRPLTITRLRKFQANFKEYSEAWAKLDAGAEIDDEAMDKAFDLMVDVFIFCVEKHNPALVKDRDHIEENLDIPTWQEAVGHAGGVDFGNPNQMEEALAGVS